MSANNKQKKLWFTILLAIVGTFMCCNAIYAQTWDTDGEVGVEMTEDFEALVLQESVCVNIYVIPFRIMTPLPITPERIRNRYWYRVTIRPRNYRRLFVSVFDSIIKYAIEDESVNIRLLVDVVKNDDILDSYSFRIVPPQEFAQFMDALLLNGVQL